MKLNIESYDFSVGLPRPLTFAFVSDLHDEDGKDVLAAIEAAGVDAVLVGGDIVHDDEHYQKGIRFLTACAEKRKTFCCIGNHERYYRGDLAALITASGAVLLDDAMVEYGGVWIGGLSSGYRLFTDQEKKGPKFFWRFQRTPAPQLSFLSRFASQKGFKLLLCHHPEYWPRYIRSLDINLTLAGHAHGGQWRIGRQGVFAPGQGIFPRYTSGLYQGRLLVSRGIGNPHRVPRIGNAPMVAIITLS